MSNSTSENSTAPDHPAPLSQAVGGFTVATPGPGMTDISGEVTRWLDDHHVGDGLVTVFIRHTSASLTIQENADPDVQSDLISMLSAGLRPNMQATATAWKGRTTCRRISSPP